jgi:hypothetical protein
LAIRGEEVIVSGYTLNLYCDSGKPHDYYEMKEVMPGEFAAQTLARTFKEARKAGWVINRKSNRAICPFCSRKRLVQDS